MPRRPRSISTLPFLRSSWRLAALPLALAAGTARADTVWLVNGDRITCTIQSLDNGYLRIHTEYGGDMRIAFDHVKTLQSDTPLVIRDESMRHDYRAKLVSGTAGQVVLNGVRRDANGTQAVQAAMPLNSLESVVRPHPFLNEAQFTGHVDLAVQQRSASTTTQDYSLAMDTTVRHGLWRHQFNGAYQRSKESDSVNTNNYTLDYTLDRFLTEKAFWQVRLMHRQDWVEDLRRQTAYGTGPGYQFWDDELGAFSMSALLGRVRYGYSDDRTDSAFAASIRWDYKRYFSAKQFEFFTKGELMRPFGGNAQIAVNGEIGVRYNVNDWLSLYMKYARNQVSSTFESLNESIYSTGLGVRW